MAKEIKAQLTQLSMYERAILMYCLHAYFKSGNYTTKLPLGEMLPDLAMMYTTSSKIDPLPNLTQLSTPVLAADVAVFDQLRFEPAKQQLVATLNRQANLNGLLKIVDD
ncbi:hypothetical protein [Lactiplantibacillus plajomi]|uniref:Uncharacterized protein n=1 Tax=Lactiplantibacillus plajomi TaxID=1457217 RepID=A0ABV6K660_9LACO|nr:hypothetical protein [Lactiplantibacillus plajomi]